MIRTVDMTPRQFAEFERRVILLRRQGLHEREIAQRLEARFTVVARVPDQALDRFDARWQRAFPKGAHY